MAHNPQPDAEAAAVCAGPDRAFETFKYARLICRGNARAGVSNLEENCTSPGLRRSDVYRPPSAVLDSVGDQIVDDLLKRKPIAHANKTLVGHAKSQKRARIFRKRSEAFNDISHKSPDVSWLGI